jgi:RNA polymerase sigma-70 factor (ECF subfamily)
MIQDDDQHLEQMSTEWTQWHQAHRGEPAVRRQAQRQFLERYGGAIRRYLGKVARDPETADELFQEFALRLVRGDLHTADPQRGRLRCFLKGVLFRLIAVHRRIRRLRQHVLSADHPEPVAEPVAQHDADREFLVSWREELLARSWAALAEIDRRTGQPLYQVLRFRTAHPEMRSPQMAEQLTERLGRPFSAAGVRQTLHRAREKFAEVLLREVAQSLPTPAGGLLEQELSDLGLLEYCRPALERQASRLRQSEATPTNP